VTSLIVNPMPPNNFGGQPDQLQVQHHHPPSTTLECVDDNFNESRIRNKRSELNELGAPRRDNKSKFGRKSTSSSTSCCSACGRNFPLEKEGRKLTRIMIKGICLLFIL
jgi:hypothetical protein